MTQHSHDDRVRLKADEIWLQEGRPEGRDHYHWTMAREAIGREDAYFSTLKPSSDSAEDTTAPAPVTKLPAGKQTKAA